MDAIKLYQHLEKDFITAQMSDDWITDMGSINDFLSVNFKKREMGLVCDFATQIHKVYTAVFPSREVMQKILDTKIQDAMLFLHHPSTWDIRKAPETFQQMERDLLQQFKKNRISIFNLHVPLDNFSKYSTSVTLANALEIESVIPFAPYFGSLCGVFGKTNYTTIEDLRKKFEKAVGHKVVFYNYGDKSIKNQKIAIVAGGGNDIDVLKDIVKAKINTFVTGITVKNDYSEKTHEFAQKNKINILGGTHYSTEKFACISMVDYFKKLGIDSEFISDKPVMEDM